MAELPESTELTAGAPARGRKGPLGAMGLCFGLGSFNDNFFKQAGLLLAASAKLVSIQGVATLLFALPFVLFSAWAGWLADLLPKKRIIVWAKAAELAAMGLGFFALYALSWPLLILVVFIMGLQAAFFSPALNGAIPELFASGNVPKANAYLKMASTAATLLGLALAGAFLDIPAPDFAEGFLPKGAYAFGRVAAGLFTVLLALAGLAAAFRIGGKGQKRKDAAPFPRLGPIHSIRHAREVRASDRELFLCLMAEAFFYLFSTFVILCVTNLGTTQMGLSLTATSLLNMAMLLGVAAGSLISGRWPVERWRAFVTVAGAMTCLSLIPASLCVLLPDAARYPALFCALAVSGICGGLYLIPITSFIQVRPAANAKGRILGISNFSCFTGIMLAGPLFSFLLAPNVHFSLDGQLLFSFHFNLFTPAMLLGGAGILGLLAQLYLGARLSRLPGSLASLRPNPVGMILRMLLPLRYRCTAIGLENIPWDPAQKKAILFLPNHPALVDPLIVYAFLSGARPRPLISAWAMPGPLPRAAAPLLHPVLVPDMSKVKGERARQEILDALERIADILRDGQCVLFYPAGRIYHSRREALGGNSGLARLLQAVPDVSIVLVRTTGLWGSSFSMGATGEYPRIARVIARNVLTLLANGIFFMPRRKVELEFVEAAGATDFPRQADRKTLNAWLEGFYNARALPARGVPRFFWKGSAPYAIPDIGADAGPDSGHANGSGNPGIALNIGQATREKVYAVLREVAGLEPTRPLRDDLLLNADLDLDSLSMMDVVLRLEEKFKVVIAAPERLIRVGDCLLAATGQGKWGEAGEEKKVPRAWFSPPPGASWPEASWCDAGQERPIAPATTVAEAFLRLAKRAPHAPVCAEWDNLLDRRKLLTVALLLADRLRQYPGKRLGLMLPAASIAPAVWLASMLAGKETVLLNWTTGEANLRHCANLAEVRYAITSDALITHLESQGLATAALPLQWISLEKLAASLRISEKLLASARARFMRSFARYPVREIAAILFTSGSEALPKGVPLTHNNLLTNARDLAQALGVRPDEKIAATLPTFHSFGLMADMVIPLALGIRAAYFPNPTSSAALSSLVHDFKLTLLPLTPAFLQGVLDRARGTDRLDSVRFAFIGAEKPPAKTYRDFAELCPQAAFCEGYGITECSPVVSVNRPGAVRQGTLGQPLPSVEAACVRELGDAVTGRVPPGETGMLLVRGPSVFSGYLGQVPSPFVEFEGKHWYRTGDLVSLSEDGYLTFQGRLKRFAKIGGETISLPQVEEILLGVFGSRPDAPREGAPLAVEVRPASPAVSDFGATADRGGSDTREEIVLFTPMDLSMDEANSALRQAGLGALHRIRRVVKVDAIPLLGSGKTDYRSLRESARG